MVVRGVIGPLSLAAAILLGGPSSSGAAAPETHVFELASYPFARRGYEGLGSSLRAVDPGTLRPVLRRGLRLGGYAASLPLLGPDRQHAAVGLAFGELVVIDLSGRRIVRRLELGDPERAVRVVSWPRGDLIVAHACTDTGKYGCLQSEILLVDPGVGRVARRIPLAGSVSTARAGNRALFLVQPTVLGRTRLVVVDPTGRRRSLTLGIRSGTAQRRLGPFEREAALAVVGRTAVVVAARQPVALVDVARLRVRYRKIAALDPPGGWLRRRPAERWHGTVGPSSHARRLLLPAWPGTLAVLGSEGMLDRRGARSGALSVRLLDLAGGRVRLLPVTNALFAGGRLIGGWNDCTDERCPRATIHAFDRRGRRVYSLRPPWRPATWRVFGRYLYVGDSGGGMRRVYDARTGTLLREIARSEVEPVWSWREVA